MPSIPVVRLVRLKLQLNAVELQRNSLPTLFFLVRRPFSLSPQLATHVGKQFDFDGKWLSNSPSKHKAIEASLDHLRPLWDTCGDN